jgi:hypothetical protein
MTVINMSDMSDKETALILATDRMHRVACAPLTRATAKPLRELCRRVEELTEGAAAGGSTGDVDGPGVS